MATVYITDETEGDLRLLAKTETRSISDQVKFLVNNEMDRLGIPRNAKPSVQTDHLTQVNTESQGNNDGK